MKRFSYLLLCCLLALALPGCGSKAASRGTTDVATASANKAPLPASAYSTKSGLSKWIDPDSGYDTTRTWKLDGGTWPIMMVLSPSQSPQALWGMESGDFQKKLAAVGVTPELQRLDGPPRVFHALERAQWPIVYMPLAVFMDYVRSPQNQGGAGGLQYVLLAGSTAGGGYTLISKDPSIKTVADLKGKKVAFLNTNPVPGTLLTRAVENDGLKVGEGANDVHVFFGEAGKQMNAYMADKYDALVTLNIYKAALLKQGSHPVTDFADVGYTANYTVLVVERSVYEKRPDVVKALLEAHYQANAEADAAWKDGTAVDKLLASWNGFFENQNTKWSSQRPVPSATAYKAMLGNMQPELRLDRKLIEKCFKFNSVHGTWGWPGTVDPTKVVDYEPFNAVLKANGAALQ